MHDSGNVFGSRPDNYVRFMFSDLPRISNTGQYMRRTLLRDVPERRHTLAQVLGVKGLHHRWLHGVLVVCLGECAQSRVARFSCRTNCSADREWDICWVVKMQK